MRSHMKLHFKNHYGEIETGHHKTALWVDSWGLKGAFQLLDEYLQVCLNADSPPARHP